MKVGRLVYGEKPSDMSSSIFCNLGDNIQTIALDQIVREALPMEKTVDINIYNLKSYDGDYVLLPLNCNFWTCDEEYFLPASDRIIPLFLGVSFQIKPYSERCIDYLKRYQPIGCRDYCTLEMMRKLGIEAYLNGCITVTLPKRELDYHPEKTFFIDAPEEIFQYVPSSVIENSEKIHQTLILEENQTVSVKEMDQKTTELYERYRTQAKLIVTSKLHCAAPCMAMGIPVIIARKKMSRRFEWINRFLHIYLPDEFSTVKWDVQPPDISGIKKIVRENCIYRIRQTYERYKDITKISSFYEQCQHSISDTVEQQIVNVVLNSKKCKYIIWGGSGYLSGLVFKLLSEKCPSVKLTAVIDEYKDIMVYGHTTVRSDILKEYRDAYVIVTTASGEKNAVKYMNHMGFIPEQDYFTFSMIN